MDPHPIRKRKGRACDQCRKSKSRCEDDGPNGGDRPCRNCVSLACECTYNEPVRKRGPPKGYMNALEQRLSNAEGLLGAIICSNDSRATSLISDLSTDVLANSIIQRVREGEFGLGGRAAREIGPPESAIADAREEQPHASTASSPRDTRVEKSDRSLMSKLDDVFTQPSLEWQDTLNLRLALGAKNRLSREISTSRGEESGSRSPEAAPPEAPRSMYQREDTRSNFFVRRERSQSLEDELESMDTDNPPDRDLGKGQSDAKI